MKLIIAEKPSQARSIVNAIPETFERKDGYSISKNWIVTNAFGHIYKLADIEKYREDYDAGRKYKWSETQLPWIPAHFEFKWEESEDAKKQIKIINDLMNRKDVDEIIGGTDIDSEGELIYRNIIRFGLKGEKKITRMWPNDQTAEVLWQSILNRKDYLNYDSFYKEALLRTYADFLLGINLTRGLTLKTGELCRVGRVITAIVDSIYKRDKEIEEFKSTNYWQVESVQDGIRLGLPNKFNSETEAKAFAAKIAKEKAVVKSVETKDVEKQRPKLFSQSSLQSFMGTKEGMSPDKTLAACQKLYENKLLTYPRTNSEYLTNAEKELASENLKVHVNSDWNINVNKKVFDDKKVEAHSAIIPTKNTKFTGTSQEQKVYDAVLTRFKAAFCPEACVYSQTKAVVGIGDLELTITGNSLKQKGWQGIEETKSDEKTIPALSTGQFLQTDFKVVKRKTTPPSHYTIKSLNAYCLAPFKKTDSEDDEYKEILEGATIGQESTRASIINNAITNGLISLKGDKYLIQPKGKQLIEMLKSESINLDAATTVDIQKKIKKTGMGAITQEEALTEVSDFIIRSFEKIERLENTMAKETIKNTETAVCPWCGGTIYKRKGKYGTFYAHEKEMAEECNFKIGQNIKFYGKDIKLTEKQLDSLVQKGGVKLKNQEDKFGKFNGTLEILEEPSLWNGKTYVKYQFTDKEYTEKN